MIEDLVNSVLKLNEESRSKYVRAIKCGIFVDERIVPQVAYKMVWVADIRMPLRAAKREALRRISGLSGDEKYYLDEEDSCLVGYLAADSAGCLTSIDVQRSNGKIISCRNNLHPGDYLLVNHPAIHLVLNEEEVASLSLGWGLVHIHPHAFQRFVERLRETEIEDNRRQEFSAQRACLMSLYHKLKNSVPVERKNAALQIIEHDFKRADYRANGGWIFVIEEGNVLKTAYLKVNIKQAGYRLVGKS